MVDEDEGRPRGEWPPDSEGSPHGPVEPVVVDQHGRLVLAGFVDPTTSGAGMVLLPVESYRQWLRDQNTGRVLRGDTLHQLIDLETQVLEMTKLLREVDEIPRRMRVSGAPHPERMYAAAVALDRAATAIKAGGGDGTPTERARDVRDYREAALYLLQCWLDGHGEEQGPIPPTPRAPTVLVVPAVNGDDERPVMPPDVRRRTNRALVVMFALDLLLALGEIDRAKRVAAAESDMAPLDLAREMDWIAETGSAPAWEGVAREDMPTAWRARWVDPTKE